MVDIYSLFDFEHLIFWNAALDCTILSEQKNTAHVEAIVTMGVCSIRKKASKAIKGSLGLSLW